MAVAHGRSHSPPVLSSSPDCFTPEGSSGSRSSNGSSKEEEHGHAQDDDEDRSRRRRVKTTAGGGGGNTELEEEEEEEEEEEAYELDDLMGGGRGPPGGRGGSVTDDDDENDKEVEGDTSRLEYTAEEERVVVKKFDRRLVLFMALLYMLSFLDRSNIGNAYTAGMDEDLLEATDPLGARVPPDYYYEWALTAFYLAYIAFGWLSVLWVVVPAHAYVSALVLSWGVVASLQAIVPSYPWLIALRALLGAGEAGFTGVPVYLSIFFRRDELALRTAAFVAAAPLAMTFASSLAWAITALAEASPGQVGVAPWRLLFLVEGFPAVVVATLAWRVLPDAPGKARYLTEREKKIAQQRLLVVRGEGGRGGGLETAKGNKTKENDDDSDCDDTRGSSPSPDCGTTTTSSSTWAVLRDPVPWATAAIFFLTNVAYSSLPVFLPAILTQMGHPALAAQALSAPPYLVAFVVVLAVAAASDALQARAYLIAASALCSALGYAFLSLSESLSGGSKSKRLDMARYLAIYPAAAGFFCVVVLTMSLNVNNAREHGHGRHHKGAGFALMQVVGQCGPLVGTRLFDPKTDGPWFTRGMGICAGAMLAVAGLAVALRWHLARRNRQWDADADADGGDAGEEEGLVGGRGGGNSSDGGGFRYML